MTHAVRAATADLFWDALIDLDEGPLALGIGHDRGGLAIGEIELVDDMELFKRGGFWLEASIVVLVVRF